MGYFDWGEGRLYFLGTEPWSKAIDLLQKSVGELKTVWYNYLYLAAAQNANGDSTTNTMTDFTSAFGTDACNILQRAKTQLYVQTPTTPFQKARNEVYNFVLSQIQALCP